jgi:hypothetical protein
VRARGRPKSPPSPQEGEPEELGVTWWGLRRLVDEK